MSRAITLAFQKLNGLIFQHEINSDQKKAAKSKSELNRNLGRITKDEFFRELGKTLSVLANR